MSFLCPVRVKKTRRKSDFIPVGRITGSDSLDTLVQVQVAKEEGTRVRMVIIHDFEPCVEDEVKVSRGQQVYVLYQENDWLYIITEDKREGFVPYNYCLPLERSVDDFANIIQKGEHVKKSVPKSGKSDSGESSSFSLATPIKPRHRRASHSMPDIAQACETKALQNSVVSHQDISRPSDRLKSRETIGQDITSTDSGLPPSRAISWDNSSDHKRDVWDTVDWVQGGTQRGRPSRRSIASAQLPAQEQTTIKPRSLSLDRTDCVLPPHFRSPRSSHSSNYSPSHRINNSQSQRQFSHLPHSGRSTEEHIYANASQSQQKHIPNQPDVLPSNIECYSRRTSMTSNQGSMQWNNSSIRSDTGYHQNSQTGTLTNSRTNSVLSDHSGNNNNNKSWFGSSDTASSLSSDRMTRSWSDQSPVSLFTKVSHGKYIALFGFRAREENDVSLTRGEFVKVLNTDDEEWTWVMKENKEEGFVPSNYICPAEGSTRQSNMRRGVSSRNSTRSDGYLSKYSKAHTHSSSQTKRNRRSYGSYRGPPSPTRLSQSSLDNPSPRFTQGGPREPVSTISQANSNQDRRLSSSTRDPRVKQMNNIHGLEAQYLESIETSNTSAQGSFLNTESDGHETKVTKDIAKMTQLVCLYNFSARSGEDLSVTRGDWLYTDFEHQEDPSWLWVYSPLYRRAGFVPRSYVKQPNFGYQQSGQPPADVRNVRATQRSETGDTTDLDVSSP